MKNSLVLFVTVFFILRDCHLIAQTSSVNNVLSESITFHPIPEGSSLMGVFEGRPPCREIAKQLGFPIRSECTKIKWRLTLYHDPLTLQPATYQFLGSYMPQSGRWKIVKGTKSNPGATVYQLELGKSGRSFYFLKGDENVLFILNEDREFRVGNAQFSYTLNRVKLIRGNKPI